MKEQNSNLDKPTIRPIALEDNPAMAQIIRTVMTEYHCVGEGYSINDAEVDSMFESYLAPGSFYLVIDYNGKVEGGGGIGPLQGGDKTICELKKMYFSPVLRGKGLGGQLLSLLLQKAKNLGYTECYLETVSRMIEANGLYKKFGFSPLKTQMGNTGHSSCDSYYYKNLEE